MRMTFPLALAAVLAGLAAGAPACAGAEIAEDNAAAVILAYHGVGEEAAPDSSLSAGTFADHVREISDGSYTVMPLPVVVAALRAGDPLPQRAIAITFEGAQRSAYENAMPLLLERKIPFTVFFSPGQAGRDSGGALDWDELRRLAAHEGVTLGILPDSYAHIAGLSRADMLADINAARTKFRERLGREPTFFSYPFGEISLALREVVREQGFEAAFGQQSGCASPASDILALPRFSMTDSYGDLERFRLVTQALPLPAQDIEPADPLITDQNPAIGFSLPAGLEAHAAKLSCFVSGQAQPSIEILGNSRVEIRLAEPLMAERTRINCTMPGPGTTEESGWRWFGMLLAWTGTEAAADVRPPQQAGLQ